MCGEPKIPREDQQLFSCPIAAGEADVASALPGGHWPTKTPPGRGENVPAVGNVCDILHHTSRALVYLANSRCILVLLDELMDSRVRVRTQVSGSR